MQSHLDLILLVEIRQESLRAEARRHRLAYELGPLPGHGLRPRIASTLVALAVWLDRQAASARVEAALSSGSLASHP